MLSYAATDVGATRLESQRQSYGRPESSADREFGQKPPGICVIFREFSSCCESKAALLRRFGSTLDTVCSHLAAPTESVDYRYVRPAPDIPPLTKQVIAEHANALLPNFQQTIRDIPPEAGFGGIWESEMFLFYAAVAPFRPRQILESGRARGKSTLILARCFPDAHIVSVELERDTDNAAAAEAKLKAFPNVELVYGDSRKILPERLQSGDAVLIDGPKEFRGIELAIELLHTGKPCAVFVHDFPPGSSWRKFVEREFPEAFFADDPLFDRFRVLDEGRDPRTGSAEGKRGAYGIFACFPPGLPKPYWRLRTALMLAR